MSDDWSIELGDAWEDNVLRVADAITRGECRRMSSMFE